MTVSRQRLQSAALCLKAKESPHVYILDEASIALIPMEEKPVKELRLSYSAPKPIWGSYSRGTFHEDRANLPILKILTRIIQLENLRAALNRANE